MTDYIALFFNDYRIILMMDNGVFHYELSCVSLAIGYTDGRTMGRKTDNTKFLYYHDSEGRRQEGLFTDLDSLKDIKASRLSNSMVRNNYRDMLDFFDKFECKYKHIRDGQEIPWSDDMKFENEYYKEISPKCDSSIELNKRTGINKEAVKTRVMDMAVRPMHAPKDRNLKSYDNIYARDVSNLFSIDIYTISYLYEIDNPCLTHALKKILMAGKRGYKDAEQDLKEARDSIDRAIVLEYQMKNNL